MSMKELVVCKFAGCNQVYNDARFLPCGSRTCASHIETMLMKRDETDDSDRKMIKCHFCQKIHHLPVDEDEFPVDTIIPMLLSMKYCNQHDAAKKTFGKVTKLLDKLLKLDKEEYAKDVFERVENEIKLEKEANLHKLLAYYQKLLDDVHERKIKCLRSLKTNVSLENELEAIRRILLEHESKLKRDNVDFMLKTLDGDETRWREIQSECNKLMETTKLLGDELMGTITGDRMVRFIAGASSSPSEVIACGQLAVRSIDSSIVRNHKMESDLVDLCKLRGKQLKLIYRATRDGFEASAFHDKCDFQPKTLSIVKTSNGCIFGGYTAVAWDSTSRFKDDPHSFIFSLVNADNSPQFIPIRVGDKSSIYCVPEAGPAFGAGCDIYIRDNSNRTQSCKSNLGCSYDFKLFSFRTPEAQSFLAGSYNFQTSEIEVFQLN